MILGNISRLMCLDYNILERVDVSQLNWAEISAGNPLKKGKGILYFSVKIANQIPKAYKLNPLLSGIGNRNKVKIRLYFCNNQNHQNCTVLYCKHLGKFHFQFHASNTPL